jgi:hypothetical protein
MAALASNSGDLMEAGGNNLHLCMMAVMMMAFDGSGGQGCSNLTAAVIDNGKAAAAMCQLWR